MATDQRPLARLLYPDHFNEAGERIDPPTTPSAGSAPNGADPAADHNELIGYLLRARDDEADQNPAPVDTDIADDDTETADFRAALADALSTARPTGDDT